MAVSSECYMIAREETVRLREQLEQAQARVAELEDALSYLREPWDLGHILGAETRRRVEFADSALAGNKTDAWLLRKQAEAVVKASNYAHEELFRGGALCAESGAAMSAIMEYAQGLRQQADELEAGGEHAGSE